MMIAVVVENVGEREIKMVLNFKENEVKCFRILGIKFNSIYGCMGVDERHKQDKDGVLDWPFDCWWKTKMEK